MPNGFHGPKEEWERMEAPYRRIDPVIDAFARRHGLQVVRNYRDADRSLRFNDDLSRALWVNATDKYGIKETYEVSIIAHQDRETRYLKAARVGDPVGIDDLERVLERATTIVRSWTANDLEIPLPPRQRGKTERID